MKRLDYVINSVISKVFDTMSNDVTDYCREAFGVLPVKDIVLKRREVLLQRFPAVDI